MTERAPFTVVLEDRAGRKLELLLAEARGPALAAAIGRGLAQLERFPWSGPRQPIRGGWSETVRYLLLGRSGFLLFYEVHEEAELVLIVGVQHQAQRRLER